MKKKTLYYSIISLVMFAAFCIVCGIAGLTGVNKVYAAIDPPEPTYEQKLLMCDGASIRKSDPSGIRFMTYVNSDYYTYLESQKSAGKIYDFRFGTIYVPATVYKGTLAALTHSTCANVNDIIVGDSNWGESELNGTTYKTYVTVQLFTVNARDNGYYGVKLLAKSYVYVDSTDNETDDGVYTYTNGVERSIAQVAAGLLSDGYSSDNVNAIPQYAVTNTGSIKQIEGYAADSYICVPYGGGCDFTYTPALLHSGSSLTAASDYAVKYDSSDEGVFTVDNSGAIKTTGAGTANLSASISTNISNSYTVRVAEPSTEYSFQGEKASYLISSAPYGKYCQFVFNADYINDKIAKGYSTVQFAVKGAWGGRHADLIKNGNVIQSPSDSNLNITLDTVSLSKDDSYTVRFLQAINSEGADITIAADFTKSVKAVTKAGSAIDYENDLSYTFEVSTMTTANDTITYTFKDVPNLNEWTNFCFNAPLINAKIAEGYKQVAFTITNSGWKNTALFRDSVLLENKGALNPSAEFVTVNLVADSFYRIQFNHNIGSAAANIEIKVQFIKPIEDVTTSTTTYDFQGETTVYKFSSVPKRTPWTYADFDADYINAKIAAGYSTVQFTVQGAAGGKVVKLVKNGTIVQTPEVINGNIVLDTVSLATDDCYTVQFWHAIDSTDASDIAIKAYFTKSVKAITTVNGADYKNDISYTSEVSTTTAENDTITYTFSAVPTGSTNHFCFNVPLINEKIAAGFTKVTFSFNAANGVVNRAIITYSSASTPSGTYDVANGSSTFTFTTRDLEGVYFYRIQLNMWDTSSANRNIVITAVFS